MKKIKTSFVGFVASLALCLGLVFSCVSQAKSSADRLLSLPDAQFEAVVSYVIDGDSVEIQYQDERFILRLLGADAPEKFQDYGEESRLYLGDLIADRNVKVRVFGKDFYGRWLARLNLNDLDVNLDLVEQGAAWCFFFSKDEYRLFYEKCMALQDLAQTKKRGLWSSAQAVRPSEWRKELRDESELRESEQQAIDDLVVKWVDKLRQFMLTCKQWVVSLFD